MLSLALLWVVAAPAPDLDLEWTAPAPCPAQTEVELRIADLVGRPVTVGPGAAWAVRVRVERGGAGFVAELGLGAADPRRLDAKGCDALVDAVAVIVALALDDPPEAAPPPPPPPPPTVTATVARAPPRPRVVRPRPAAKPLTWSTPVWGFVDVELGAHLGLPDPGVGVGASLGLRYRGWSAAGGAVHRRGGTVSLAEGQTGAVEVTAGLVRGCGPSLVGHPWRLELCLLGEVGVMRLSTEGRAEGIRRVGWAETGVELGLGFRSGRGWSGLVRAQLRVAAARPRGLVDLAEGPIEVFGAPPLSAGLSFSVSGDVLLTD